MAELSKLVIVFGTDLDDLKKGLSKVEVEMKKAERGLATIGDRFRDIGTRIDRSMDAALPASRVVATAVAGLAAAMVGAGIAAVKMASDADETRNKFNVVFGDMSDSVRAFANATADEMGRSSLQMEEFLAKSQAILKPLLDNAGGADQMAAAVARLTGDMTAGETVSAKMSKSLTALAVDLGSFLNISDTEALDRLISGMLGSTEAVDQLGINLRSTELEAEALRQGIDDNVDTMDEATKMFLRFAVIMRQTKDAQGDAARTADSFSNQLKTLGGNLRDLGAAAGDQITKTLGLDKALQGINKALSDLKKTIDQEGLTDALANIFPPGMDLAIYAIAGAITGALAPALVRLGAVAAASLISIAPWIAGFAALGVAAAIVVKNMPAVVDMMRQVGDAISGAAENVKKLPKDVQDMVAQLDGVTKGLRDKVEKGAATFKDFENAITATDAVLRSLKSRQDASSIGMQFQIGLLQTQRDQLIKSKDAWLAQKLGIEGSADATNEAAEATGELIKNIPLGTANVHEFRLAAEDAEEPVEKIGRRIHQWNPIFLQASEEMRRLTLRLELFGGSGDALKDRLDVVTVGMDILFKAGKENSGMFKELQTEADGLKSALDSAGRANSTFARQTREPVTALFNLQGAFQQLAFHADTAFGIIANAVKGWKSGVIDELSNSFTNMGQLVSDGLGGAMSNALSILADSTKTQGERLKELGDLWIKFKDTLIAQALNKIIEATGIINFLVAGINAVIHLLNSALAAAATFFGLPAAVGIALGAVALGVTLVNTVKQQMAGLAEGGIVTGPTMALIGEGREPEAVLPLSKLDALLDGGGDRPRREGPLIGSVTLAPTKESAAEQMRAVNRLTRRLALEWGL